MTRRSNEWVHLLLKYVEKYKNISDDFLYLIVCMTLSRINDTKCVAGRAIFKLYVMYTGGERRTSKHGLRFSWAHSMFFMFSEATAKENMKNMECAQLNLR